MESRPRAGNVPNSSHSTLKWYLREFVLRTATVPFVNRLYRLCYHLAVRLVTRWVSRHASAAGLYARGSYGRGDFVPGRSDLDLVILLSPRVSDLELRAFLTRSRTFLIKARTFIPFLGEAEFVEACHFEMWLSLAPDRHDFLHLWGVNHKAKTPLKPLEKVWKAVSDYQYFLLPNMRDWSIRESDRLLNKISGLLAAGRSGQKTYHRAAELIRFLKTAVKNLNPTGQRKVLGLLGERLGNLPEFLVPWENGIESAVANSQLLIIVVRSGLPTEQLAAILETLEENHPNYRIALPLTANFHLSSVCLLEGLSLIGEGSYWGKRVTLTTYPEWENFGLRRQGSYLLNYIYSESLQRKDFDGWFPALLELLDESSPGDEKPGRSAEPLSLGREWAHLFHKALARSSSIAEP